MPWWGWFLSGAMSVVLFPVLLILGIYLITVLMVAIEWLSERIE